MERPRPTDAGIIGVTGRPPCLQDLLEARARSGSQHDLIFYPLGDTSSPEEVSYHALFTRAKKNSASIRSLERFQEGSPILLSLGDNCETILWFWSVLLANGLPVLSPPLSNLDGHRSNHLQSLSSLLGSPICITNAENLTLFDDGHHSFEVHTIETLLATQGRRGAPGGARKMGGCRGGSPGDGEGDHAYAGGRTPAFLMLTSGSTGEAKAACLTHHQVLSAVEGKASVRQLPRGRPFLNWIGLDHVASLVEIHLQALWLGVGQVHVHAADILLAPTAFLDLLSSHRVSRSFAPNFFLARLVSAVEPLAGQGPWDLSDLTLLASGGEANSVKTCVAVSALLERHGAPRNVVVTGFGMTETCAGAIFNTACPEYDVKNGNSVSSLGLCMKGIEMRVTVATGSGGSTRAALPGELGDLEVRGDVVFDYYYGDPEATAEAFTPDGCWFHTGDQARIDAAGCLNLGGRLKDVVNINGVKFSSTEVQEALEGALEGRVARVISFPSRTAHTEQITVAYIPRRWPLQADELFEISEMAAQACFLFSGHRPLVFCLSKESLPLLPTTTLGKVSRAKMRGLFEADMFARDVDLHREAVNAVRQQRQQEGLLSASEGEASLVWDFAQTLGTAADKIGLDTPLFELGCTSMDLVRLKHRIDRRLGISVPIVVLMRHPTVRSLAAALSPDVVRESANLRLPAAVEYDPVVTLRSHGAKTPLWLVHPGVGEVLVFVGLAQHMSEDDRPVHALRARGFEPGQERFPSIAETVQTYVGAVRRRQPQGPYAIAGYSYGTMLAFEMAKLLGLEGGEGSVRFLGSFNLPPHIKTRMRHLNWNMCLLHLAYFLGLTTEEYADGCEAKGFRAVSRAEALAQVLQAADGPRMSDLGLGELELARWADVAFGLQSMACDYEPSGMVDVMDVFHAIPLRAAAASPEEWVTKHLSRWEEFCRTEPRFHAVGGAHYTMLGPDHVSAFSMTLQAALKARGL